MIDLVVKLGGGTLAHREHLKSVLTAIASAARTRRVVVVPGGGPFADLVRQIYRARTLSEDAAHWMAVLAMDQHAHLIASELTGGVVVTNPHECTLACDRHRIPVLAPSRWLQELDPLPHSWDVTSDSIAAWVAGRLGATHLVLVKPPGATGPDLVDAYFALALPRDIVHMIVPADQPAVLASALDGNAKMC